MQTFESVGRITVNSFTKMTGEIQNYAHKGIMVFVKDSFTFKINEVNLC